MVYLIVIMIRSIADDQDILQGTGILNGRGRGAEKLKLFRITTNLINF